MNPALQYLELALRDARVIELRYCHEERWTSSRFTEMDPLRAAIRERAHAGNLYISLNRPKTEAAANTMCAKPLTDAEIERVVRLPIDFDPSRPAECMATREEVAGAVAARDRFVAAMRACGWPMPLTAMSGSGAHALYRCSIPAGAELREMLTTVYNGWRGDFGTEQVGFDVKVRNPSRIFRLYGTANRKGENTPERPWRRATCMFPAAGWQAVQVPQIEALANRYARRNVPVHPPVPRTRVEGAGDIRTLDLVGLMQSRGLYKRPLGNGKHAVSCPWVAEHSCKDHPLRTDTVVFEARPGEWPGFYCSHGHCEGRGIRELLDQLGNADAWCSRVFDRGVAA